MRFSWSERKRASNIEDHGIDFVDAVLVFATATFTFEDDRFDYSERRFNTPGLLAGVHVAVAHTEHDPEIRIPSFRKATRREADLYFKEVALQD